MKKSIQPIQRFTRHVERCSVCGATNPFVRFATKNKFGKRIDYLVCKACGAHATRLWID